MSIDKLRWENPEKKYRVNLIVHSFPQENRTVLMDAINDFKFGGVVTNPNWRNWYEGYADAVAEFKEIIAELEERELSFWIYDEKGYPSGFAGGEVLNGHPELEAKGFYMRRMVAFEPRHVKFQLDHESDKIVWAAKYPLKASRKSETYVQFDQMTPVPFADNFCETDLGEMEALFVFCTKSAYEGAHCTHNMSSRSRYINVMDQRAVRRFIDLMLEPIAKEIPDAFRRATAVFTDEPSLQVGYVGGYENWPYALAPWAEGLLEAYEKEYGESMLPHLPQLFEGLQDAYPIRVRFYRLVGKLIADAYSGQIASWCREHGGVFSGHYMSEESMMGHVREYGAYIKVLSKTGYPGIDVLRCYPEIYNYNTAKMPQMAARKMKSNGMMAELCPFRNIHIFEQSPVENMIGVVNILYLSGVRTANSYFSANLEEYDPALLKGRKGYLHREEAQLFNEYVGRLGYMLDGIENDCNTFVYYGIEDVQGKMIPQTMAMEESETDNAAALFTKRLFEAGQDFYYADRDDLVAAASEDGIPKISGHEARIVIVPALDIMDEDAYDALCVMKDRGTQIYFLDKVPEYGITAPVIKTGREHFSASNADKVMAAVEESVGGLLVEADGAMILKGRFWRDGNEMWMLCNNTRKAAEVRLSHDIYKEATLYVPMDGKTVRIQMEGSIEIPSLRAVFIVFDRV